VAAVTTVVSEKPPSILFSLPDLFFTSFPAAFYRQPKCLKLQKNVDFLFNFFEFFNFTNLTEEYLTLLFQQPPHTCLQLPGQRRFLLAASSPSSWVSEDHSQQKTAPPLV
jgi:hypothetical protein